MTTSRTPAFVIGGTSRYAATTEMLAPGARALARTHDTFDALFYVTEGTVGFMVDGFEGFVSAGGYLRVAAGSWYGYRNADPRPARLLTRLVPRGSLAGDAASIVVEDAA